MKEERNFEEYDEETNYWLGHIDGQTKMVGSIAAGAVVGYLVNLGIKFMTYKNLESDEEVVEDED